MKAISQFVVHVFDLIEAEGGVLRAVVRGEARRARSGATTLAVTLAVLAVSVAFGVVGCWLLGSGLLWWLQTQVSRPLAAALTGLVVLATGAACFAGFRALARRQRG